MGQKNLMQEGWVTKSILDPNGPYLYEFFLKIELPKIPTTPIKFDNKKIEYKL